MVAIGFSLDDLDLVVDPFQLAGMDGVFAVVQDAFPMALQHSDESVHRRMADRQRLAAPVIQRPGRTTAVPVAPDPRELVSKQDQLQQGLVERKQRPQMLPVLLAADATLQKQELRPAVDVLVLLRGSSD